MAAPPSITPEAMAAYRATARQQQERERQALIRRRSGGGDCGARGKAAASLRLPLSYRRRLRCARRQVADHPGEP